MTGQWIRLSVTGVLLGMPFFWGKMLRGSARPAEVTREYKRINAQALWFLLGFVAQIAFYFAWGAQHGIEGKTFVAGLWIVCGSSMLLLATVTKAWVYLGWALPMLAYGLCQPLLEQQGLWLGLVFIVAAFLSWAIQGAQSRLIEVQHGAD